MWPPSVMLRHLFWITMPNASATGACSVPVDATLSQSKRTGLYEWATELRVAPQKSDSPHPSTRSSPSIGWMD
ncbi:hypothetical protein BJ166DRAFT_520995 [Pestalotiopsis sp. NC0098]|nr:hypothetical protein BJ166DRAFT_520995 [Pestalotiopsis sp. NC0098]